MFTNLKIAIVTCVLVLAIGLPAFAHHGNAEFDLTQSLTLKATVTDFVWSNPHSEIFFDVKETDGKLTRWSCEAVQPALLHRAGWTKDSLKPGDQVTIVLHPAKNGKPIGYLQKVVLANGDELRLGSL